MPHPNEVPAPAHAEPDPETSAEANDAAVTAQKRRVPGFLFVIATLLVSMPLLTTGNVYVGSLVAVKLSADAVSASVIGWVMTLHSIGFLTGTLFASGVIRRVGHIRAFAGFAAMASILALLYPMEVSAMLWGAWRLLGGLVVAGLLTVTESWVAARSDAQNRGRLLAVYSLLYYMAAMGGQLLLTVSNVHSFVPFSIAAMLIVGSMVPMLLGKTEAPTPAKRQHMSVLRLLRAAPLGVVGAFVGGFSSSAFFNIGPVFGWSIGMDAATVGVFMAVGLFGAMCMQFPVGWAADKFGRARVFPVMVTAGIAASVFCALWAPGGGWAAFVGAALYMAVATTLYPLSVGDTNSRLAPEQILPAASGLLFAFGLGTIAGPVSAATAVSTFGPAGLFLVTAMIQALFAVFGIARATLRDSRSGRSRFIPMNDGATLVWAELRAEHAPAVRDADDEDIAHMVPDGW